MEGGRFFSWGARSLRARRQILLLYSIVIVAHKNLRTFCRVLFVGMFLFFRYVCPTPCASAKLRCGFGFPWIFLEILAASKIKRRKKEKKVQPPSPAPPSVYLPSVFASAYSATVSIETSASSDGTPQPCSPFCLPSSCFRFGVFHDGFNRNVSLVGWNSTDVGNGTAVLSCQGRDRQQSRVSDITGLAAAVAETSKASRGIWLSEGRITRLANLTVTGGG